MTHKLPPLPYDYSSLEPFIDEETMKLHHGKHHQAYVDKLNQTLEAHPDLAEKSIENLLREIDEVPEDIRKMVTNHGGGHYNHTHFWKILSPHSQGERGPQNALKQEIEKVWGSFEKFKEEFTKSSVTLFGSGWTWLAADENGENLHIHNHPLQENPLLHKHIPVLGLDVWEHAYYLKYQNRRAEYIEAFWNVVNWDKVEANLNASAD